MFDFNFTFNFQTFRHVLYGGQTTYTTHHAVVSKRYLDLFRGSFKLEVYIFPSLNIVPSPFDCRAHFFID